MQEQQVYNLEYLTTLIQNSLIKTFQDAEFDVPGSKAAWLRYVQNYTPTEEVARDFLDNIVNNIMHNLPVDTQFLSELMVRYVNVDAMIFCGANQVTMPDGSVIDVAAMRNFQQAHQAVVGVDYSKFNK